MEGGGGGFSHCLGSGLSAGLSTEAVEYLTGGSAPCVESCCCRPGRVDAFWPLMSPTLPSC